MIERTRDEKREENYKKVVAILAEYDLTPSEHNKRRFEHPSNLFYCYVGIYDNSFSVSIDGRIMRRSQYITYYFNTIDYAKLGNRIKRVLKKAKERQVSLDLTKKSNDATTQKLINYMEAYGLSYVIKHPFNKMSMAVQLEGNDQTYYVGRSGTVSINLAGKRMTVPLHNMPYIMDQVSQLAVDTYEDVTAQFQSKEEVA